MTTEAKANSFAVPAKAEVYARVEDRCLVGPSDGDFLLARPALRVRGAFIDAGLVAVPFLPLNFFANVGDLTGALAVTAGGFAGQP